MVAQQDVTKSLYTELNPAGVSLSVNESGIVWRRVEEGGGG